MKFAPVKRTTTFIAVPLPPAVKRELQTLQAQLARRYREIAWEIPEKLHITIAYLGRITTSEIETVLQILTEVMQAAPLTPFVLHIQYLNYFFQP